MGYESRVYVGERFTFGTQNTCFFSKAFVFDLCKMGNFEDGKSFNSVFTHPIDFELRGEDGEPITIDCYGEGVCYATIDELIPVLQKHMEEDAYYREKILLNTLATLKSTGRDGWVVCHYGY